MVFQLSPSVHSGKSRLSATAWRTVHWPHICPYCLNSLVCSSRYLHRWFLFSFRLERGWICRTVSLASLFRSWMRRYKGSCLKARWLRPWCHPFCVVICPHGFFKHSLVWWGPGGAIDPVAGHVLSEGLQCDRSLTLEAVKHWPDFVLWQEGQRWHLSYEVEGTLIMAVGTLYTQFLYLWKNKMDCNLAIPFIFLISNLQHMWFQLKLVVFLNNQSFEFSQ